MLKHKAFKFRIYPTTEQQIMLGKNFGCVRLVFNHFLKMSKEAYENNNITLKYKDYAKELNRLKQEKEFLKDVSKCFKDCCKEIESDSFKNSFSCFNLFNSLA